MEEKKRIKSLINDIINGIKLALVFGLNIGFIIGIIKGASLVSSNRYFQNSLHNLALDTIRLNINSAVSNSVLLAIGAIIAFTIIKIYGESALGFISSFMILLYIGSFRRINPLNYLLFTLLLYGLLYPIGISAKLREKFGFLNRVAKWKLILASILLIVICNGFIYSYRVTQRSKRPNIILISIDALRADHLGCYGYHRNTSPNIDQLTREGSLFKNCFSQATWTLPSHASIFLSQYAWAHNVEDPHLKRLTYSCTTLAEILKNENYATAAFTGGVILSSRYGFDQGFEIYDDGSPYRRGRYEISSYTKRLLSWLESVRNKKFFLFIHTYDVHGPYNPPSPYFDLYTKGHYERIKTSKGIMPDKLNASELTLEEIGYVMAVYDGGINYVDEQLGKVFEKLDQLGIDDNTVIIVTADHGEAFKEHGKFGHGGKPYIEEVHVPLIMKGSGIPKNRIYENYVQHIDIVPTILEILNIPKRREIQGRSLLPLMKNFKIQEYLKTYSCGLLSGPFSMSLRTKEWTYIMNQNGPDELYNRMTAPKEQNNIIEKRPFIAQKLKEELKDLIALTREAKPQVAEEVHIGEELKERL
ncbi:sulfatase-like hydrolase/transferase, partial [bacterium]|nr:sulfatase-like hydrolase/transferase [bacterium]